MCTTGKVCALSATLEVLLFLWSVENTVFENGTDVGFGSVFRPQLQNGDERQRKKSSKAEMLKEREKLFKAFYFFSREKKLQQLFNLS